jgi:hypothetical protein
MSSSVFRADLGFLTVHLISVLEVILMMGAFWRMVSVGFNLLNLILSDCLPRINPLGLAVHGGVHVVLVLRLGYVNPLGLGACVPGSEDLGVSGGVGKRSASTTTPQAWPWSCSVLVAMVWQMLRVALCQSPQTCYFQPLLQCLPRCVENYWGSCV